MREAAEIQLLTPDHVPIRVQKEFGAFRTLIDNSPASSKGRSQQTAAAPAHALPPLQRINDSRGCD